MLEEECSVLRMRDAVGYTQRWLISCEASRKQHTTATGAQHGTAATHEVRRHHTTRMQQTNATTQPTARSKRCDTRDTTNAIRTLAHLGLDFVDAMH